MHETWLVVLPPIIVLITAFITRKLNSSLFIGLCAAALIYAQGNIAHAAVHLVTSTRIILTDIDNLYMYLFLIAISILIVVFEKTGSALAFAQALTKKLNSAQKVETTSMLMSAALFIDDYLSTLTVGYVMRPLTDRFNIARVKLAFLIHTFSGPLVILVPITSWLTMISTNLDQVGVTTLPSHSVILSDPFSLYLQAIPFIFYSLLMLLSAWFIVARRISYGPMRYHEDIAQKTGNLFGGKNPPQEPITPVISTVHASVWDLIVPLLLLVGGVMGGILWSGGWYMLGGTQSFVEALQKNSQTALVLCVVGTITLLISFARALRKKQLTYAQILPTSFEGFNLIKNAILMLILVTTLGHILRQDLHTGNYLATTLLNSFDATLLPGMFFLVAAACSIMIGSSWGTISMLIPIAIPMLITFVQQPTPFDPAQLPLLFPLLGAIFSGAVCGDHLSPISQTTIIAATSSGCYPVDHVNTQLPYAIPALIGSTLAFFLSGLLIHKGIFLSFLISISLSLAITLLMLYSINRIYRKRNTP